MPEDKENEKKMWNVDPTMYKNRTDLSLYQKRIAPFLRTIGKFGLISLAITYPLYIVLIGILFGGIAFWAFFLGSFAVTGLVISRLGFASNFRNWGQGFKPLLGIVGGFIIAIGFYEGLFQLRAWFVLPVIALAVLGFFLAARKLR